MKKKRINKAKGAIKTKRSFQEKFGLSEEGIVGIWDFITKLLSFISILEIIIFIWKKIINYNRDKYNTLVHDMNKR